MSDAAGGDVRWVPLESNPEYMHNLGMSKDWIFTDVYGLDDELLMMVPQPVLAVILLFPYDDKYKAFAKTEQENIEKDGQIVNDGVYFMKQTIRNACGTIGVLHAVLNCRDKISQDDTLKSFYEQTKDMTPEERGKKLECNESISHAHGESAQEGQTEAPQAEEDVCPHFIALVEKDGCVYELDGNKKFPINHGPIQEGFLKSAAKVCKMFMDRDPDEVHFTIMALSRDS
ncbi:ubiquitin carboxyl-terminal hydrolase isozyme L3 isoform X2 [Strongylocentrotus purpuratus]|uniref:Ubiquitin carboxyl-terminal hydrolase n=1 Tax=Strongylocentrotus purpuratus TaxID=7668 RepID=A0A7M7NMH6_STRPU|nr:ubiquitin carboxyl-terminal hydrolase isozyme L3 isoform X2 [Strongylocentrotus purpuratus]